jgi:hypothetical protein
MDVVIQVSRLLVDDETWMGECDQSNVLTCPSIICAHKLNQVWRIFVAETETGSILDVRASLLHVAICPSSTILRESTCAS